MPEKEIITQREFDTHLELHQRQHTTYNENHTILHAMEAEARDKAVENIDRRLEGMNEFRDQLKAQAATFVTRAENDLRAQGTRKEIEGKQDAINSELDTLKTRMDKHDQWKSGIEGRTAGIGFAIGIAVIVINILLKFIT
jgi:hypothetical protein